MLREELHTAIDDILIKHKKRKGIKIIELNSNDFDDKDNTILFIKHKNNSDEIKEYRIIRTKNDKLVMN